MKGGLGDGDRMIISKSPPLGCRPAGVLNLLAEVLCLFLAPAVYKFSKEQRGVEVHHSFLISMIIFIGFSRLC